MQYGAIIVSYNSVISPADVFYTGIVHAEFKSFHKYLNRPLCDLLGEVLQSLNLQHCTAKSTLYTGLMVLIFCRTLLVSKYDKYVISLVSRTLR